MNPFQLPATLVFVMTCSTIGIGAAQTKNGPEQIRWSPHATTGVDGQPIEGEIGRLSVPENRRTANGKSIELAFVRFRTSNPEPGPPIVYLVGGPGPSGIENCIGPATGRMLRLLDYCDVIGLDQRGTGLCRPNLEEGPDFTYELPTDRAITRADYVAAYREAVVRCVQFWREQGVDLSAYNSIESADDIDDLRKALGVEQIMTWGQSYGTHLTLAYLRRHAEHAARSILIRVEGPDHTLKLPSTTQRYLEQLHELVAADETIAMQLPDFLGVVRALLKQLAEKPVTATVGRDGSTGSVTIGAFDLQFYLANVLGLAYEMRDVPAAVERMSRGDWSELAAFALENRRGEVGSAMALMMDCASGATPARLRRIAKEARDPAHLLGDAVNVPYPDVWAACGDADLGDAFRGPMKCSTPVLFVSGSLDARTPPGNVDEICAGFSNYAHVIATHAGHEPIEMLSSEYRELLQNFLRGKPVKSRTIELPSPRFAPVKGE